MNGSTSIWCLLRMPLIVTWSLLALRVLGERLELPGWLASKEAGGSAALLGISWLPLVFGPYFALRLADRPVGRIKALMKTLITYGLLARMAVVLITFIALATGWEDNHFVKFGPDPDPTLSTFRKVWMTLVSQLGFWVFVWTLGAGTLAGWITLLLTRRRASDASA